MKTCWGSSSPAPTCGWSWSLRMTHGPWTCSPLSKSNEMTCQRLNPLPSQRERRWQIWPDSCRKGLLSFRHTETSALQGIKRDQQQYHRPEALSGHLWLVPAYLGVPASLWEWARWVWTVSTTQPALKWPHHPNCLSDPGFLWPVIESSHEDCRHLCWSYGNIQEVARRAELLRQQQLWDKPIHQD